MQPLDVARGLQALKETMGWSNLEIERQGIMLHGHVHEYLELMNEESDIQEMIVRSDEYRRQTSEKTVHGEQPMLTTKHVIVARDSGLPPADRSAVLRKAAEEDLSASQTRKVAEAVKAAPTPEVKRRLLETSYAPHVHDPEVVKANLLMTTRTNTSPNRIN